MTSEVVFLVDVDNTLLDNDRIVADLRRHLEDEFGGTPAQRYWMIFEQLRSELGYVDYLGALQRYRSEFEDAGPAAHRLLLMSGFLIDYPFRERLFPRALEVIAHLRAWGPTVILSDGDAVFQPRKVLRSGLWNAVGGQVLICVHKEQMLDAVRRHFPARHYVMVDDKLWILAAMKAAWGRRLTTVFARQGHYAFDPAIVARSPAPDITVGQVGDLADFELATLLAAAAVAAPANQEKS